MKKLIGKILSSPKFAGPLKRFRDASEGVAAVEFALIAPLLLLLFLGTVETSYAVAVDRKLSRASSAIADLITQQANLTEDEVRQIIGIADKIMYPYDHIVPCIVISGVQLVEIDPPVDADGDGKNDVSAKVTWSIDNMTASDEYRTAPAAQCNKDNTNLGPYENARKARAVNSDFPIPDVIRKAGFLVISELEMEHTPAVAFISSTDEGFVAFDEGALALSDRIILRPRLATVEVN